MEIFKYVKAASFIPAFTDIKFTAMVKHKLRGKDGNGNPTDFSEEEKQQIREGLKKMLKKVK